MIINSSIPLETQPMMDCGIISIPLIVVGEASGQMCRHEAQLSICVLHPNGDRTFVACYAGHSCLLDAPFDVLDLGQYRSPDEYAEGCADKLATSQHDIFLAAHLLCAIVQSLFDGFLPGLFSGRIAVHDLLRTQFHNLLEADHDYFRLGVSEFWGE
jgi:hypothetical protein